MRRSLAVVLVVAAAAVASSVVRAGPAPAPVKPTPNTWSPAALTIAWVGHASVLIDFGGTRLLTDPAFFDRVGVQVGPVTVGPRRLVAAALRPDELPPLDAVLLSHAHMDSLDRPSLRALTGTPLVVMPPRTRDLVDDLGFPRVVELAWGQSVVAGDVEIEAVEVSHWGKRWPWDAWRGYCGFLLTRHGESVLFASDTADTRALGRLATDHHIVAAILGIGAYDPWIHHHVDPEQAWHIFRETGAAALIPIHWDTFRLGKEPLGEAMARLLAAAGPDADRVVIRRIGETWAAPAAQSATADAPAGPGTADTAR